MKLLPFELNKFDGDRSNCVKFRNQFETTVHTNPELGATEKFQYLVSLPAGKAASAISGILPTEECYKDAIALLKQRFGDQALLVQDHMQALLDLKLVALSSDVELLRNLYDCVQVHCRSLKALSLAPTAPCFEKYCYERYLETWCLDIISGQRCPWQLPRMMIFRNQRTSMRGTSSSS